MANNNRNLFVFSTNSYKKPNEVRIFFKQKFNEENQVHLIDYDEETNKIFSCGIYQHPGVIHKVFPSPLNSSHLITSYSECKTPKKYLKKER